MKLAATVLCALLLGTPAALPQRDAVEAEPVGAAAERMRFPTPPRALTLAWEGDGPALTALLEAYALATGRPVLMTADTRQVLGTQLAMTEPATSRIDVPPTDVHEVFETLLRASDLALVEAFDGLRSSAVQVVSLRTQDVHALARRAVCVPAGEIEPYRNHPAVLVTTWVPVGPGVDAATLSTELYWAMRDPHDLHRFALACDGLVLRGFGPGVCKLVDFVREVNALAGGTLDTEDLKALVEERFPKPAEEPK